MLRMQNSSTSSSSLPTWRRRTAARRLSPATSASSVRASSDAKFFYETDLKTRLEDRLPKFEDIVFHEKLGHPGRAHRTHRTTGRGIGAAGRRRRGEGEARGAALQGRSAHRSGRRISRVAGRYGEILRRGPGRGRSRRPRHARITTGRRGRTIWCRPIRFPSPLRSPTRSTRSSGFWAIDEKPTGSKDPYALTKGGTRGDANHSEAIGLRVAIFKWLFAHMVVVKTQWPARY